MASEETKKDAERKERPKAPENLEGGGGEPAAPLAEALGGEEPAAMGGADDGGGEWAPSMDWLMGSLGPFFNNNQGIGELLLDKLKESGVNTEGVALAGLVNVLQQFSKELKSLNDSVGDNLQRINELSSENENLSRQLQEIVSDMGLTKDDGGTPPAGDLGGGMDAGMPPPDMGGGMDAGVPPAGDMGAAPPPDMGGGMDAGMPPPDMGGGMPPGDVMSDENMKRKVVSDRRMKRLFQEAERRVRKGAVKSTKPSGGIVSACIGGME